MDCLYKKKCLCMVVYIKKRLRTAVSEIIAVV